MKIVLDGVCVPWRFSFLACTPDVGPESMFSTHFQPSSGCFASSFELWHHTQFLWNSSCLTRILFNHAVKERVSSVVTHCHICHAVCPHQLLLLPHRMFFFLTPSHDWLLWWPPCLVFLLWLAGRTKKCVLIRAGLWLSCLAAFRRASQRKEIVDVSMVSVSPLQGSNRSFWYVISGDLNVSILRT